MPKKKVNQPKEVTNADLGQMIDALTKAAATKESVAVLSATIGTLTTRVDNLNETIDSLAAITSAGFAGVTTRLDKMESNHANRLGALEDKNRIITTAFENKLNIKLPK